MALIEVVTTAGENLNAQALGAGADERITRIEVGQGFVDTEAKAKAVTGVQTPFNPKREALSPPVFTVENTAQTTYFDSQAVTYDFTEMAIFAGDVCMHYQCDDAGAVIGQKRPGVAVQFGTVFVFEGGDAALENINFILQPLATMLNYGQVRFGNLGDPGAVVLSATQIEDLINNTVLSADQLTKWWTDNRIANLDFAETPDMVGGTTNETEVVSPARVDDYWTSRIHYATRAPTPADGRNGDFWLQAG